MLLGTPGRALSGVASAVPAEGGGRAETREVLLFGSIDSDASREVVERLIELDQKAPGKEIDLLINSTGGSIGDARAIISVFQMIDSPVNTICVGYAWSSAATILAAGTGERQAFEHGSLMIHELSWEDSGPITSLESTARQGRRDNTVELGLLAKFTGRSSEELAEFMYPDHYFTAAEARDYGLVDAVLPISAPRRR